MNDNQQVVLEKLKQTYTERPNLPFVTIEALSSSYHRNAMPTELEAAFGMLTCREDFEVLKAFAEWGLEREQP